MYRGVRVFNNQSGLRGKARALAVTGSLTTLLGLSAIPGLCRAQVPDAIGPRKEVEAHDNRMIAEAFAVESPLLLDPRSAFHNAGSLSGFKPTVLQPAVVDDLRKPLPPGDYAVAVTCYGTPFTFHAPGRGLPYALGRIQGKQADAISALLVRGTLLKLSPAKLNAVTWRIQAGIPLSEWPAADRALAHKLVPDYEDGLQGDLLARVEEIYDRFRDAPGIPPLDTLLDRIGPTGQFILTVRSARPLLTDATLSAERLPDRLYEPQGDDLPRVLPQATYSQSSPWAEIQPGVFGRLTILEGSLSRNLFEFRVDPKATNATQLTALTSATGPASGAFESHGVATTVTLGDVLSMNPYISPRTAATATPIRPLIGYAMGQQAQALILVARMRDTGGLPDGKQALPPPSRP